MKRYFLVIFLPLILFATDNPIYVAPPSNIPIPSVSVPTQKDKKNIQSKPTLPQPTGLSTATIASASTFSKGTLSEVMIIHPEMRAKDLESTIQFLKQNSPTSKPTVRLTNGTNITNIISVDVMPGGTILIFRLNSLKGVEYKVVKIETIDSLTND